MKNIERPIRAYRVTLGKGVAPRPSLKKVFGGTRRARRAGGIGLVSMGVLATIIVRGWPGQPAKAPAVAATATGPTPAMSIAVLSFAATGGNPADDQFSDSLTRDVTTAVGRSARYAWIVSYGLTSGYRGKAIDARAVGRELNVRYVAEGEIRRAGENRVLEMVLIDSGSGTQVWSDRLDIPTAQPPAGNDAIVAQISKSIRYALVDAETRRAARQSDAGASAVGLWLRGNVAFDDG